MDTRPIDSDSAHGAEPSTDDRWIQAEPAGPGRGVTASSRSVMLSGP